VSRKNLFSIAASRMKSEDRLTEMLAYLWQERPQLLQAWLGVVPLACSDLEDWIVDTQRTDPELGRFDVILRVPSHACVIVESKLGSDLGVDQVARYVQHLSRRTEPYRALVTLTERRVEWPAEVDQAAAAEGVVLAKARWRDVRATIQDTEGDSIADDFAEMLLDQGLVRAVAVTPNDLSSWNVGASVLSRLVALLDEAAPYIEQLHDGLRAGRTNFNERLVYRTFAGQNLNVYLGFSANESATKPASPPIIWAGLENPSLQGSEGKTQAEQARDAVRGKNMWGFTDIYLSKPAADVLQDPSFEGQAREAVAFVFQTVSVIADAGLMQDAQFRPPDTLASSQK
jgi:hypothetical protein